MSSALYGVFAIALTLGAAQAAQAEPTETVLYRFGGGMDGVAPQGGLIQDATGALYGVTAQGGPKGCGTVFKLSPPVSGTGLWNKQTLYSFQCKPDGSIPNGALAADSQGNLYGTTEAGGNGSARSRGCGTVYRLEPPSVGSYSWSENVLAAFDCRRGGYRPYAGVVLGSGGAIYGTTSFGGHGNGLVFQITAPTAPGLSWTETVIHTFSRPNDGVAPDGGVILGPSGTLYGSTRLGGKFYNGTVYRLTPQELGTAHWRETILYDFPDVLKGRDKTGQDEPAGLVMDASGALYGTTYYGGKVDYSSSECVDSCGTAYRLNPPAAGQTVWTQTILHIFHDVPNGFPASPLTVGPGGHLYGTTLGGNAGTVFSLSPPTAEDSFWPIVTLHRFKYTSPRNGEGIGIEDSGVLLGANGTLYGATFAGGRKTERHMNGNGVIFSIVP